jgi:hypothetical protein
MKTKILKLFSLPIVLFDEYLFDERNVVGVLIINVLLVVFLDRISNVCMVKMSFS